MDDEREAVESFLDDDPDAEGDLRALLAVDEERPTWTFDDVPLDSGRFGEAVSRGVVERADGEYRLADPEAVRRALGAEPEGEASDGPGIAVPSLPSGALSARAIDRVDARAVALLAGALTVLVGLRLPAYPAVFRDGAVVLSANDPYYYRYWVEVLLARSTDAASLGVLSTFPDGIAKGEPLLVATIWWVASLLGGDARAAGLALAWYPVVSAAVTGAAVYLIAARAFGDRRVGAAAALMFAIVPVNGFRASLGFADHHAFDFPWLALTVLALVAADGDVGGRLRSPRAWIGAALLGVAVAGQTLAWDASPILLGALGAFVGLRVIADVHAGRSPVRENAPALAGLLSAAVLSHLAHVGFGWHTDQVAYAPALVLAGAVGVVVAAELVGRLSLPAGTMVVVEALGIAAAWYGLGAFLPTYASRLEARIGFLLSDRAIVEMQGLFGEQFGTIIGPVFLFGFVLFLALPYLAWATARAVRSYEPGWLAVAAYAWYFLALSAIQIRFAGELAPVVAVFAGLGFLHLAAAVDAARVPRVLGDDGGRDGEDGGNAVTVTRSNAASLLVVFLLVGSLSLVQIPVKTNQLTIPADAYRAAAWIDEDSEARNLTYPSNYVFSQWDRNRMYNYFVSGESRSYGFARANYAAFLASNDSEGWYGRLRGRAGYVVTTDGRAPPDPRPGALYVRLHREFGSRSGDVPGVAHYRAVYASGDGTLVVFQLVPGATIRWSVGGDASAGDPIAVSTRVDLGAVEFAYERRATPNATGAYAVTVPYPGEYRVGDRTVTVNESAVLNGTTVDA